MTSTVSGRSSWRRAKRHRIVRESPQQEIEIAQDRHQYVVEVVRDAAGELAQAFQLLHLVHLCHGHLALAGALFDAAFELGIGLGELGRPLFHPLFQLRVQ